MRGCSFRVQAASSDGAEQLTECYAGILGKMLEPHARELIQQTLDIFNLVPPSTASTACTEQLEALGVGPAVTAPHHTVRWTHCRVRQRCLFARPQSNSAGTSFWKLD
jgi:hypothetical protein